MRGENGTDEGAFEERLQVGARDPGFLGVGERALDRAGSRLRAGDRMRARPPRMVRILGDVGEMREIAERAHDERGLLRRQCLQDLLERLGFVLVAVAMETDGGLADLLDRVEDRVAFLVADRVAEDVAEEADVFAKRTVLVGKTVELGELRCFRFDCQHHSPKLTQSPGRDRDDPRASPGKALSTPRAIVSP